ncbi:hypothetical protein V8D89_012407, partial [Ganoderma adspersum]
STIARVHRSMPAKDVPQLVSKWFHCQIINVQPLASHWEAAYDLPLALCNYRIADRSKGVVPIALECPDPDGEAFGVKFNPAQNYDSQDDSNTAVFTPHTASEDPSPPKDVPLRESIELRLLVFYN